MEYVKCNLRLGCRKVSVATGENSLERWIAVKMEISQCLVTIILEQQDQEAHPQVAVFCRVKCRVPQREEGGVS